MTSEYIKIKKWPTEHALEAYENKNYVEAIQVLHGWIENKLQELIILVGSVNFNMDSSKTWDIANQIGLIDSVKVLYILSQIDEDVFKKIIGFNALRNKLIHKIFHEPFDKEYKGIPKIEYDNIFNQGIYIADFLQSKTEMKIEE